MRTTTRIHTPQEQREMRLTGGRLALRSRWRLLAGVMLLRTAAARIIPLCGSAAWWAIPLSLTPGLALHTLARIGMRRRGRSTLTSWPVCLGVAALLAAECAESLTALAALFTQGVGARGTQFTMALAAALALLPCLKREALSRGCWLLRGVLLAALAVVAAGMAQHAGADGLFPLMGGGSISVAAALGNGVGMGWVFLLPLLEEPPRGRGLWDPLPPALLCSGVATLVCMLIPCEELLLRTALADSMLAPLVPLGAGVRLIGVCLWMAGLFLAAGCAAQMSAEYALRPAGREVCLLAWAVVVGAALLQWGDAARLWETLGMGGPWRLAPLAIAAAGAWLPRRKTV